jgi:CBS domain-containing protein
MSVKTVCNHNVATVDVKTGVVEAAAQMRTEHVGDLIVVEHRAGRRIPIGILTDRDIVVAVVAKGIAPNDVTVADAMSPNPLKVKVDNGIEFALREMRRVGVRRAPVVDEGDDLVGVLSIDDVIDHLAVQLGHIADIVRLGQQTELDKRP